MCGIIGYVGDNKVTDVLMHGLKRLEYRGYDSAGITVRNENEIKTVKSVGKIINLEEKIKELSDNYYLGIGHTRWATHGLVSETNSHPHTVGNVTLVHNGIIENYRELKSELVNLGYEFKTETDTEVVAALLDSYKGEHMDVIMYAQMKINGSYAFSIIFHDEDNVIYALRKDSPLIIGIGENENFIASDIAAILPYTKKYIDIEYGEVVKIFRNKVEIYKEDNLIEKEVKTALWNLEDAQKQGYEHYMLKEINEQKELIEKLTNRFIVDDDISNEILDMTDYNKVDIVACGSAFYAGLIGKHLIEKYTSDPNFQVNVDVASEYRYKKHYYNNKTLLIVISQSGETADTLACLRMAKQEGVDTLAIVNVLSSSIAKEAKFVMPMIAGPEIAVATTKGYFTQVLELSLLALRNACLRNMIDKETKKSIIENLKSLPMYLPSMNQEKYKKVAEKLYDKEHIYFIGRGVDYLTSLEACLKLKEISYIHSESYQAGELKHGPIALIEEGTYVLVLLTNEELKDKTLSNAIEAKSRGAKLILLVTEDIKVDENLFEEIIIVSKVNEFYQPLVNIIPFQLIAYEVANLKQCDIDKPKNLAKSVTVE